MKTKETDFSKESMLLSSAEAAKFLHASVGQLTMWRKKEIGPKYIQFLNRGKVFYRKQDLEEFLEDSCHDPANRH